uniref:Uncharacterized protein n=1 Tax=Tanacetum cinerariifolium TaxID=118510 RepID=A0A6L2KKK2_TANCI|nr:hypothetical protein [Tanacetum cinerariifolium]
MEEDDFVHYEPERPLVITFTKAKPREYDEPNMRYSKPCGVKGIRAWDAECNLGRAVRNAKIRIHGCEMKINIGEFQDDRNVDWLLEQMLKEYDDEGNDTWEKIKIIKMGKAYRLKNKNKISKELSPPPPFTPLIKEEPISSDSPPPSPKETPPPLH